MKNMSTTFKNLWCANCSTAVKIQMFGGETCHVHVKVDHVGHRNSIQKYTFATRARTLNRIKNNYYILSCWSSIFKLRQCGDLNRRLTFQFKLRQIVDNPTRRDWTLDLVLITNLPQLYDKNSVQILSPFGLSDHNVVNLNHKTRATRGRLSRKQISRSHTLASKKLELGGYLLHYRLVACGSGQ